MPDPSGVFRLPTGEPTIRTMKSDVAEFLKTTKPSLVSILAKQASSERPYVERPSRRWIIVLASLSIGLALAGLAVWYFHAGEQAFPIRSDTPLPNPFFYSDNAIEGKVPSDRKQLVSWLKDAGSRSATVGTFTRLAIRADDAGGGNPAMSLAEFLHALGVAPPIGVVDGVVGKPEFFLYHESAGPRFGFIFEARNPNRVLQALFGWEPSIQRDFEQLFIQGLPASTLKPFKDATFRNIDYRYLAIDSGRNIGIGYLQFEARHLIVIATSEESVRMVINRLFRELQ